jgi:hypothetical protein
MGQEKKGEPLLEELEGQSLAPRRHRPVAEVRLPASPPPRSTPAVAPARRLDEAARARLWSDVRDVLFDASEPSLVRRVWTAPPLEALADRMPADVEGVLERWFMLVEATDVYRLLESVHDALEPPARVRFVANVNARLDHAHAGYRFVLRRLVPMASRSDSTALERALAACRTARWVDVEAQLAEGLDHLGQKPEPDVDEAIRCATTAAQLAATAVTGTAYADLAEALYALERAGHVGRTLGAAYQGLPSYVTPSARRTSEEEARLIVLTCAGLVTHLASRH